MKEDFYIIYLIEHLNKKSLRQKIMLYWLKMSYPSYEQNDEIKYEMYKRKYIEDLSGYNSEQDEYGNFHERPDSIPEVIQTTSIGEKAIFSKELKSEKFEDFFDKTTVRIILVVSSLYGLFSFIKNIFS